MQGCEGGQGAEVELGAAGDVQDTQLHLGEVGGQGGQVEVPPQGQPLQVGEVGPGVGDFLQAHPAGAVHRHGERELSQLQAQDEQFSRWENGLSSARE